jgi:hypothetical protein
MDSSSDNPPGNQLGPGVAPEQILAAVKKSGYPLQKRVANALRNDFDVQEEWCYVDRDTKELRSTDIFAQMRLYDDEWSTQPRVSPNLTVLVECKQSQLPYVFFLSDSQPQLLDHPRVVGLQFPGVAVSTDDSTASFGLTIIGALGLDRAPFQQAPPFCTTFSKCVRRSSELELSGAEAYSSLILPLAKAVDHFAQISKPGSGDARYFHAHLVVALAVVDSPMVCVAGEAADQLSLRPWVRIGRHEYEEVAEWHHQHDRMLVVDLVHRDFLTTYLRSHLVPFATTFAECVLRHPSELASGEGFVPHMGSDMWSPIESRLRPRGSVVKGKRRRLRPAPPPSD